MPDQTPLTLTTSNLTFEFQDFEVPEHIRSLGGLQAHAKQRMPGGRQVIQTFGAFPHDPEWSGFLFGPTSWDRALTLDAIRQSGQQATLAFGRWKYVGILSECMIVPGNEAWTPYTVKFTSAEDQSQKGVQTSQPTNTQQFNNLDATFAQLEASYGGDNPSILANLQSTSAALGSVVTLVSNAGGVLDSVSPTQLAPYAGVFSAALSAMQPLAEVPLITDSGNYVAGINDSVDAMTDLVFQQLLVAFLQQLIYLLGLPPKQPRLVTVNNPCLFILASQQYGDASQAGKISQANGNFPLFATGVYQLVIPPWLAAVTPVDFRVTFKQMGPGSALVENSPSGDRVFGYTAPEPLGIVEEFRGSKQISVLQSAYGSIGSADIFTAIQTQPFGDFMKRCRQTLIGVDIYVTADTSTLTDSGSVEEVKLFTGFVDQPTYDLGQDALRIPCRDQASLLLEDDIQARTFSDKSVRQVVQDLAFESGLGTDLIVSDSNTSLPVGTFLKKSQLRNTNVRRSSAWAFLQKMADAIGYVAFATPTDQLYFGPRVRDDLPPLTLIWGGRAAKGDILEPGPEVIHTPARNGAFHVQVSSHDPNNGATIQHTASYANADRLETLGITGPEFVTGLTETQAREKYGQIQVYNFYADGLTAQAAQAKATAHALDIQAHELIVKAPILGNANLQVGQAVLFRKTGLTAVDGQLFFIAGVTHRVVVPQSGPTSSGFVSDIVAWQTLQGS